MKKLICIMAALALVGLSGTAFAAKDLLSTTAQFQVGTANAANSIMFGLSPKVIARYVNPGTTDSTAQWYSIGTGHPGGTTLWGTAQDLNNIYSKTYVTGTEITTTLLNIATVKSSVTAWTGAGWAL